MIFAAFFASIALLTAAHPVALWITTPSQVIKDLRGQAQAKRSTLLTTVTNSNRTETASNHSKAAVATGTVISHTSEQPVAATAVIPPTANKLPPPSYASLYQSSSIENKVTPT